MHKPVTAGLVATAVLTCLVALDAAGANDQARQREVAGAAIGSPSDKVAVRGPDARVAVRNVQLASAVQGRAILGVEVINLGSDLQQSRPLREQVEKLTGAPSRVLATPLLN